jgi:Pyruvate phosphate dikinase, AMP/ATP-binding domain
MDRSQSTPANNHDLSDFDIHFNVYHELMGIKVQEILLISSPYDAYIMEEDGSLASKIINEYRGLNLSRPPRLTWTSSPAQALELLDRKSFDLAITMPNLDDKDLDAFALSMRIKNKFPDLPIILMAHSARDIYPDATEESCPYIDNTFIWTGDSDLFLALVKSVEDRLNVERDTRHAGVRVVILVEDSPLYRSFFLPLIYKEVVKQTQAVLEESLNQEHRLLKMRARPKILVAENYDKAIELYYRYRPYVFGVISDTRYPKECIMTDDAGLKLLSEIKSEIPHLPLLLLSSEPRNREKAEKIPAVFIDKNASNLQQEVHDFFLDYLSFGDFVFRSPDGEEIARASNLKEMEGILPKVPDEPILYQAKRNRFSTWIMARSEIGLASRLSRLSVSDFSDVDQIRKHIIQSIHALRKWRQKGVVAQFTPNDFDSEVFDFLKIGNGSLGGKARGLAFMSSLLRQPNDLKEKFPNVSIKVPKTMVITTDVFENFIIQNNLQTLSKSKLPNEEITKNFLHAPLPSQQEELLKAYLSNIDYPLSVRSSSLWEDLQFHPYSGLYRSYIIPNNHSDLSVRLEQLTKAVRMVYASTFFEEPRLFSSSLSHQFQKDSMAVIIQQLAGSDYGDYFYPAISGIAQSHNFYPFSYMAPEEGVAQIFLGLGSDALEGNMLRFSPRHPTFLPQFSKVDDILTNAQRFFYTLDLKPSHQHLKDIEEFFVKRDIADAESDPPVKVLSSTYDPEEHRIRDGNYANGYKIMTFASVLKYDIFPLPELLSDLLRLGRKALGCPVEFEFAVNLNPGDNQPSVFNILQIKPMAAGKESFDVKIAVNDVKKSFCYSTQSLGHGINDDIADIVYVKPDAFDASKTVNIVGEIGKLNAVLVKENRPYLLAGPGRWGSDDRWLGIPVKWPDISGVAAMVEVRNEKLKADPSQGSHFFQKITSRGIHYLTVTEGASDFIHWERLEALAALNETHFLRHVRFKMPFVLKNDGRTSRCVMFEA